MALKSVLDIDVEDAKFKRFAELFSKYNEALAKQPGMWSKVGKAQGEAAKTAAMMTAAMMAQADHMKEIAHAEREQQRHLTMASRLWTGIAGSSKSVSHHIARATVTLLKWSTITAGLATGGLYAVDRMANSVAGERRSSRGLGMSIGSMKAFGTDFGRYVDPNAFLTGIMNMRTNPAMSGALWALGVNPMGSERQVALETLNALRARAKATPTSQLGLILQSLPGFQGVSVEDLQRMKASRAANWNAQYAHLARDSRSMNIGSSTALAWQNFATEMQRAGQQIFKLFVTDLVPLAKPLTGLVRGFEHVVGVVMSKDGVVEEGINKLAKWMQNFNGKITAPSFLKSVEHFTSDVGTVAKGMHQFALFVQGFEKHPFRTAAHTYFEAATFGPREAWAGLKWVGRAIMGDTIGDQYNNPGNLKFAHQPGATKGWHNFAKFGTPYEGLLAMGNQLRLYNKRGIDTVSSIVSTYAPASAGNNDAAYTKFLDQFLHVKSNQRLALNDPTIKAELMRGMIRLEQGAPLRFNGGIAHAAAATIRVENNTGGSAFVTVNGLAH